MSDIDLGLTFSFRNPPQWTKSSAKLYREQLSQIVRAESLGFDTVWLTEHHFSEDGYLPALMPVAAAIGVLTSRIRIGTMALVLPLHNAVAIAEAAAVVDILSNGRLDLGVASGYGHQEFAGFGVDLKDRPSLIEEGVQIVRGLGGTDPFSFEGAHYTFENLQAMPKPVQTPIPLWLGAQRRGAIERVARLGCHYLGGGQAWQQRVYDAALSRYGHSRERFNIVQSRWVYLAETREQAWNDVQDHLHYLLEGYAQYQVQGAAFQKMRTMFADLPPPSRLRSNTSEMNNFPREMLVSTIGTPDDCLEEVEAFRSNTRVTHLSFGMHLPGLDPDRADRSMQLFADEVMPHLR